MNADSSNDTAPEQFAQRKRVERSQSLATILPNLPILSSHQAGWQGIVVECYDFPPYEIPEYCCGQHKLTLQTKTQESIKVKRVLDSQVRSEHLVEGDIVFVPAHAPHQVCWNQPAEFMLLALDPTLLAQSSYESIAPDRVELLPQFPTADPLIYQIGMALKRELVTMQLTLNQPDRFYVESLTTALCAHLLKNYAVRPTPLLDPHRLSKATLTQAIDYIHGHLDQEIRLVDLAQQLGFSSCYFASLFKQSTGISLHQYVIQRRLWKAKELLKTTNCAISDIALQCGFANQSHLTRLFRQHFHITPKAYRQTI